MVYISDRFESQQKDSVKRSAGEAYSLVSIILMLVQIVVYIIMCVKIDGAMGGNGMETVKYLFNSFTFLIIIQVITFLGIYVFCYLSKKIRTDLIANTYLPAINGVYFVVALVMALIYIF